MNLNDIPLSEVLANTKGEFLVRYDDLIPFREKYTVQEITEFIISSKFFSSEPNLINPYSDELIAFSNCLASLLVTWDKNSLDSIYNLISRDPSNYTLNEIFYHFFCSKFPEKKLLLDFINELSNRFPRIKNALKESGLVEQLEFDLANNVIPLKRKRAIPPEEREKNL